MNIKSVIIAVAMATTLTLFLSNAFAVDEIQGNLLNTETYYKVLTMRAYEGNVSSLQKLQQDSTKGEPVAEYWLGFYFNKKTQYSDAIQWFRKAADQGSVDAQFALGYMYEKGHGVAQDYAQALQWYSKAADQGDSLAQATLGEMYGNGQGVAQDYIQAMKWNRKAADQGSVDAQFALGYMYGNGQGVAQDYTQAMQWYGKAADQGSALAQFALGSMYNNGQGVAQDYTQAAQWYRKAADQGIADAQTNLGIMYSNGQSVAQSKVVAYALFNLAGSKDTSNNNVATSNRVKLTASMSESQIESAQLLTRAMVSRGVSTGISEYLKTHHNSKN